MPRWLSPVEQRTWRDFLEATQLLFDHLDRRLQSESSLTHADYEILVRLSEAELGRIRMCDLAAQVLFSRSRLSHAITRLEDRRLVARVECGQDRRGLFAVITDAGRDTLRAAARGHVEDVRRGLFDALSAKDVAELGRLARAIRSQIAATSAAPDRSSTSRVRRDRSVSSRSRR